MTDDFGVVDLTHIGFGGSATVYAGTDPEHGPVAVKVIRVAGEMAARRLEREVRALQRLDNEPGIVSIHRTGVTDRGEPYLVMPLLAGSLQQTLEDHGPMDSDQACDYLVSVARTIHAAHSSGVIHADIKPSNILLDDKGSAVVTDFGIARTVDSTMSMSTHVAMTPSFAAPELFDGSEHSVATDVYSLGASLAAMIGGAAPFTTGGDATPLAILKRIESEAPPDLTLHGAPASVAEVAAKAMAKDPSDRYRSAMVFAGALQRAKAGKAGKASNAVEHTISRPWQQPSESVIADPFAPSSKRRSRVLVGLVSICLLGAAAAGLFVFGGAQTIQTDQEPVLTTPELDEEEETPVLSQAPDPCPDGFDGPTDGQCSRLVPAVEVVIEDCVEGGTDASTVECREVEVERVDPLTSTSYECPSGSVGSGTGRAMTCSTSGTETLQADFILTTTFSCAAGGSLQSRTCITVGTEQVAAQRGPSTFRDECPAGQTLSGSNCQGSSTVQVAALVTPGQTSYWCPAGATGSPQSAADTCSRTDTFTETETPICNDVTHRTVSPGVCRNRNGNFTVVRSAPFQCPAGKAPFTNALGDLTCWDPEPATLCASAGFTYNGSTCARQTSSTTAVSPESSTSPASYFCPSGATGNPSASAPTCTETITTNQPAQRTTVPGPWQCPSGSTGNPSDASATCTRQTQQQSPAIQNDSYSCPQSYEQSGTGAATTCTREVSSDSVVDALATEMFECPADTTPSGSGAELICTRPIEDDVAGVRYECPESTQGSPTASEPTCIEVVPAAD